VRDNYVESDGYKIEDVERALNIDALQKYTGSESTDMQVLFDLMVAKAEGKYPILVTESPTITKEMIAPGNVIEIPADNFYTESLAQKAKDEIAKENVELNSKIESKKKRVYKKKTK